MGSEPSSGILASKPQIGTDVTSTAREKKNMQEYGFNTPEPPAGVCASDERGEKQAIRHPEKAQRPTNLSCGKEDLSDMAIVESGGLRRRDGEHASCASAMIVAGGGMLSPCELVCSCWLLKK